VTVAPGRIAPVTSTIVTMARASRGVCAAAVTQVTVKNVRKIDRISSTD
jgi:hypothetical protein